MFFFISANINTHKNMWFLMESMKLGWTSGIMSNVINFLLYLLFKNSYDWPWPACVLFFYYAQTHTHYMIDGLFTFFNNKRKKNFNKNFNSLILNWFIFTIWFVCVLINVLRISSNIFSILLELYLSWFEINVKFLIAFSGSSNQSQ